MRRWTGFLAGLSLLALVGVGCWQHTAGICDCCNGTCGLGPVGPVDHVGAVPAGVAPGAPVMPHAPVSYPTGAAARIDSSELEEHTVMPVTVHMPQPIIHSAD